MTKKGSLLNIAILCASVTTAQKLPRALSKHLIAHYRFDLEYNPILKQKDKYLIKDYSGNNNDGRAYQLTFTQDRRGNDCSAAVFDGVQSYISVPSSESLELPMAQVAFSVWVNLSAGAHKYKQWLPICCKSDNTQETDASPQYRMHSTVRTVSLNTELTQEFTNILQENRWYHLVQTYNGQQLDLYVDKKLVFSVAYSNPLISNQLPLEIGRDMPGAAEYFYGAMDDLMLFSKGLDAKEVETLYDWTLAPRANPCHESAVNPPLPPQKPDTVVQRRQVVIQKTDTVVQKRTVIVYDTVYQRRTVPLPEKIEDIKVVYQPTIIEVKRSKIKVALYDNNRDDGDIISLNFNGNWLREVDRYILQTRAKGVKIIELQLEKNKDNFLISKAWNLGKYPPNTLTIDIDDGNSVQTIELNSTIGESGAIILRCL